MKPQYQDLINRANKTADNHHDMEASSIFIELEELQSKFDLAQEKVWDRENECADDLDDLAKVKKAIDASKDALEYHHGGGVTQF